MRLVEVLSKANLLKAQQDFIDTFPSSWSFKMTTDGLEASVDDDEPMWYNGETCYLPKTVSTTKEAIALIKASTLKNYKIDVDVYATSSIIDSAVPGKCRIEADIGFKSYADAFKYFVEFHGGWKGYESNGADQFDAADIWEYIEKLTRS